MFKHREKKTYFDRVKFITVKIAMIPDFGYFCYSVLHKFKRTRLKVQLIILSVMTVAVINRLMLTKIDRIGHFYFIPRYNIMVYIHRTKLMTCTIGRKIFKHLK